MFTKLLKFQSGRGYAAEGQLIEAIYIPTRIDDNGDQVGALEFVDTTRGIDGRFENVAFTNGEIADHVLQARVMSLYDGGGYTATKVIYLVPSRRDGYQVGRYPKPVPANGHTYKGYYSDTGICDAISEAFTGGHVAHVSNPEKGRVVAIRPWYMDIDKDGDDVAFTLTFSDSNGPDLRKTGDELTTKSFDETERLVANFLVGVCVDDRTRCYSDYINQKNRDCEIVKFTKQRARIEYWLPNSGVTGAWRQCTTVGSYHYLRSA